MKTAKNKNTRINLYNVLYPSYVVSKIFGLAPYTFDTEKSTWKISKFSIVQTSIYITLLIAYLYPAYIYHHNTMQQRKDHLSMYSEVFQLANSFLISLSLLTLSIINRKKLCKLNIVLEKIDHDFKRLGIGVDNLKIYKSLRLVLVLTYLLLFIVIWIDFTLFINNNVIILYIYWTGSLLTFLMNISGTCQFNTYVYMIYKRFQLLNEHIGNLSSPSEVKPQSAWSSKNNKRIFDVQMLRKQMSTLKYNSNPPSNPDTINILCEIHDKLCNYTQKLNSMFSIHILLMTSTTFVVLVIQLYFFYLMLSSNKNYELTSSSVWTSAVWGILFFGTLYSISCVCAKTKDEADLTSVLLHKIDINENDEPMRMSIEMFSLQMLHQKVEFTACGFFPVDFSVLYMIIGAVTTYLVFLIQFEMAGRSMDDKKAAQNS